MWLAGATGLEVVEAGPVSSQVLCAGWCTVSEIPFWDISHALVVENVCN